MPEDVNFTQTIQSCKKLCQTLQSADKRERKQALIDFQQLLKSQTFSNDEMRQIFAESQMYTLNCLRDKTELVREQTIRFLDDFIVDLLPLNDFYLTYLVPVLVERIGSVELVEESEEIRLELVKLLQRIVLKYAGSEQLRPFVGDLIVILSESVKDKHPAIKELSCTLVMDVATALPKDFHLQSLGLVKPIVSCLGHQRYRVRVEAVKALGVVVMHSPYQALNDAVGPLAERLFDQIAVVRQTVAQTAGLWLMEYRDRYSFFHKLLPLLLTGLNDEVEETRKESAFWWKQVGVQYQQENEKDLKDQMDFLLELPRYYPENLDRPILGCRVLVQRNISKLCTALAFELTSWQADIRVRCSQLLVCLALHAEEGITQNLQELLPAMFSAARDDDSRVVSNIVRASELIGFFVPVKSWLKLLLPVIDANVHWGHLAVLNGLIAGSPQKLIEADLLEISAILADDTISHTRKKKYQLQLIKCAQTIATKLAEQSRTEIGYCLFKITVICIALRHIDNQDQINVSLLDHLYKHLQMDNVETLWCTYTGRLLKDIQCDPKSWLVTTTQRCIFETILLNCREAFGQNLVEIGEILAETLDPQTDAEARLKTFWALSSALEQKCVIFQRADVGEIERFFETLITAVFVPNLVWHAGMTAEALRTMAVSCLLSALTPHTDVQLFKNADALKSLFDRLLPLLLSLLEDGAYLSRQLAAEVLAVVKSHAVDTGIWSCDDLLKIYPELLKRLDDPTEQVRRCVLKLLPRMFKNAPVQFSEPVYKAHHEFIVDTLLTHFDDEEEEVRNLVFDVLKLMALINKEELTRKVDRHKPLLTNQKGCDRLLEYCTNLS